MDTYLILSFQKQSYVEAATEGVPPMTEALHIASVASMQDLRDESLQIFNKQVVRFASPARCGKQLHQMCTIRQCVLVICIKSGSGL